MDINLEEKPILIVEYSPAIIIVTLNRPERCNAFSESLLVSLLQTLDQIGNDLTRQVVILQGNGKNFCSGLDLGEAMGKTANAKQMAAQVATVLIKLRRLPQVVIAAVHGFACGGGGGIVAASDLVIAAENFKIAFPEVRRGLEPTLLFPLLRRKLSDYALRQMVLTGLPIDANRARELELVHYIVEFSQLNKMALLLAKEICTGEAAAMRFAKQLMQSPGMLSDVDLFEKEMQAAVEQHVRSWFSDVAQEGINAFLEHRKPCWCDHDCD